MRTAKNSVVPPLGGTAVWLAGGGAAWQGVSCVHECWSSAVRGICRRSMSAGLRAWCTPAHPRSTPRPLRVCPHRRRPPTLPRPPCCSCGAVAVRAPQHGRPGAGVGQLRRPDELRRQVRRRGRRRRRRRRRVTFTRSRQQWQQPGEVGGGVSFPWAAWWWCAWWWCVFVGWVGRGKRRARTTHLQHMRAAGWPC